MDSALICRIQATVQALERSHETSKKCMQRGLPRYPHMEQDLAEQSKVLQHMRQIANKLQSQVDQEDYDAVTRSLKIFYSLHHMLKPEVIATIKEIAKFEARLTEPRQPDSLQ